MTLDKKLQLAIAIVLLFNILLWFSVRFEQARWTNVPPAPEIKYASMSGLGDKSFAYRVNSLMIQNFGDTGGRFTPLKDYDYDKISDWLFLQDYLDERSNFIPYLVAYYFSGVQEPEMFRPMIPYLKIIGVRTYAEKWRWLAQGVFISRFLLKDLDEAMEFANLLAKASDPNIPSWAKNMSVFIMTVRGEKEAAYALMLEILKDSADQMHPNEVYSMRLHMCERLLDPDQARKDPLCEGIQIKNE